MENKKAEQLTQDASNRAKAEQFLKELREMPYNLDRVGQVSVTVTFKSPATDMKNPEKTREK